jgi:glyoxylase-like metal-dependent hydrolase (beta-lactamase superfamily II)
MQVFSVEGNRQRLDGGCMFGNCPRSLWEHWATPDAQNRILLACRSLLVCEDGGRKVLLEAGIGMALEPRLRERYGVEGTGHGLVESLSHLGIAREEIDLVVISHLHFDHAGGLLTIWQKQVGPSLVFPRAQFVVSRAAWERARRPHARDRASFLPVLCERLIESGRLVLIEDATAHSTVLGDGYELSFSLGHTPGLMMTRVETARGPLTFVSDCIPGAPWLHLPITMGFDRCPELLVDEKQRLLERIVDENGWVFFTHDPALAACRVQDNGTGRLTAVQGITELRW